MKKTSPVVPVKAYRNQDFLNGDSARTVRILCEYLEPEARFKKLGVHNAVIFYGSARLQPKPQKGPDWYALTVQLAERLARWTVKAHAPGSRYHIVTGGGPGIMQAAHEGAARVDAALNVGLNISLPFEQNVNPHVREGHALEFHYFFMRKFWFMNLACGAVVCPGGFGTFDEFFELLTLTQTGKSSPMPIVLFGKAFWSRVVNFDVLIEEGVISPEDLKLFRVCDTVDEAFAFLRRGLKPKPDPGSVHN